MNITGGTISGYTGVRNSGTANISGNTNITGTKYSIESSDGTLATTAPGTYSVFITMEGVSATTTFTIVGNSTEINQLTNDKGQLTIYDFSGRRVTHPTKGIYIVNGGKVVIK